MVFCSQGIYLSPILLNYSFIYVFTEDYSLVNWIDYRFPSVNPLTSLYFPHSFHRNVIQFHLFINAFYPLKCCTGDLQAAVGYALANPHALLLMVIYTFLAYIAITFHMALVQEFGGITTGKVRCKNHKLDAVFIWFFFFILVSFNRVTNVIYARFSAYVFVLNSSRGEYT